MCFANGFLLLLAFLGVQGPESHDKVTHPVCCAVVRSGYQATAHFSKGLWSLMALKPSNRELSDGDGQHGGPAGHAVLDTTSDDDDFAPLGDCAAISLFEAWFVLETGAAKGTLRQC
jgi:hypothetical protein